MKLGYSVEGSTDRALLKGLCDRWCPRAELVEGHFRGTTGQSRRREIPRICVELQTKGVDCIVFLTDSNGPHWRKVLRAEKNRCRPEHQHLTIFGVCLRNVESWLSADPDYIANYFGKQRNEFAIDDPKGIVESAFGITKADKKEDEIAAFVFNAPLHRWLINQSFEEFYKSIRRMSGQLGCQVENLLDQ